VNVRLLVDVQGLRNGVPWPARGAVVDLPDAEAADMVRSGMAVVVDVDQAAAAGVCPNCGHQLPEVRDGRA